MGRLPLLGASASQLLAHGMHQGISVLEISDANHLTPCWSSPVQALSFCGRQYVSPFAAAAPVSAEAPRAGGAKPRDHDDDDSSDSDGDEAAAAATPAPYVSAMRRTEAAAANRAQVCVRPLIRFGVPSLADICKALCGRAFEGTKIFQDIPVATTLQFVASADTARAAACSTVRASPRPTAAAPQEGKTALHWAAQFGEAGLLHELLGPGAAGDVNSADEAGNTPLHLAALNNHLCASLRRPPTHCNACT